MIKPHSEVQPQSLDQLTPDELNEFKNIHEDYQKSLFDLGIVVVKIEETENNLDELNGTRMDLISHINEINEKRLVLTARLGEKYGDKQVDLETGKLK
jgi:hypothetical protein